MSKYFTLDEMTASDAALRLRIDNTPGPVERANLERLMAVMDRVREHLGVPVLVSSGYRSKDLNKAIKGSKTSAHMRGLAVDFKAPQFGSPLMVCRALEPLVVPLGIDQLIHEFGAWVHLGLSEGAPRHQLLTINRKGTFLGLK